MSENPSLTWCLVNHITVLFCYSHNIMSGWRRTGWAAHPRNLYPQQNMTPVISWILVYYRYDKSLFSCWIQPTGWRLDYFVINRLKINETQTVNSKILNLKTLSFLFIARKRNLVIFYSFIRTWQFDLTKVYKLSGSYVSLLL